MSLPRFCSLGGPTTENYPVGPSHSERNDDLITFLAVVQSHDVDFLPVTWQSSLESFGFGGTGEINQLVVNLQTSFAFKRVLLLGKQETPGGYYNESPLYQALACEVSVLSHPVLRNHPHIADLAGVCWDPTQEDGKVRPVLVTEKTQHGDMLQFANSKLGQKLSIIQKLKLCLGVGSAIASMHASGVIHGKRSILLNVFTSSNFKGDIKPHNVLIFDDGNGDFTAKLTDFGYSTVLAIEEDDETIKIAMSAPWTAPEHWLGRNYTIAEAKATDIYSFGLLCLWFLFSRQLNEITEFYSLTGHVDFEDPFHEENIITDLKLKNLMQQLAIDCITMDENITTTVQSQLKPLFNVMLSATHDGRSEGFQKLITTMRPDDACQMLSTNPRELRASTIPNNFQVSWNIVQLLNADYRVRPQILESLEMHANTSLNTESASNAAFQCSVCYSIGLGVAKDEQMALELLSKSKRTPAHLEKELTGLRTLEIVKVQDTNNLLELMITAGSAPVMDYANEYRKEDLKRVENVYRREIRDMQAFVKDANHDLVRVLERALVPILEELGDFREAEDLHVRHLAFVEARFGLHHRDTLTSIENLASNLHRQGRYNEGEVLERQVLVEREALLGENHLHTLNTVSNLAAQLSRQGRYQEAEIMEKRMLLGAMNLLGYEHPNTLISADKLAGIWEKMGKFEMVEPLRREVLQRSEANLGATHHDTLLRMGYLAATLRIMGSYKEALELYNSTLTKMEATLGGSHPVTLGTMGNLASTLDIQGDSVSAVELLRQALNISSKVLGEDHPSTLQHKMNLAQRLLDLGPNDVAEQLIVQVLESKEQIVGSKHPTTLEARGIFANALMAKGKHHEAIRLQMHVVHAMDELYEKANPDYLLSLHNLAAMLCTQGDHRLAESNARKAYEGRKKLFGNRHESTLSSLSLVGSILRADGQLQKAWEINHNALEGMERALGKEHPATLRAAGEMASLERSLNRHDVAQELYQRALEGYSKISPSHPIAMSSKHGLAMSLMQQDRYDEAEIIQRQVLEQRRAVFGEKHPSAKSTQRELAIGLFRQGRREEAVQILSAVLAWSREYWGEEHPETTSSTGALADMLQDLGRYEVAEELLQQVLDIREKKLGQMHAHTLLAVNDLASILQHQEKYERAAAMYRRVIEGCKATSDDTEVSTLSLAAYSNLGSILSDMGDYVDAEATLLQAIEENRTVFGEAHRRTLISMRTLALCYQKANMAKEAAAVIFEVGKIVTRHNLWKDGKYP